MRASRALILALVTVSVALAGCGKRNAPLPPPDVPNTYPRPYPSE
jgi:predicted small lipoprotein YifL